MKVGILCLVVLCLYGMSFISCYSATKVYYFTGISLLFRYFFTSSAPYSFIISAKSFIGHRLSGTFICLYPYIVVSFLLLAFPGGSESKLISTSLSFSRSTTSVVNEQLPSF